MDFEKIYFEHFDIGRQSLLIQERTLRPVLILTVVLIYSEELIVSSLIL